MRYGFFPIFCLVPCLVFDIEDVNECGKQDHGADHVCQILLLHLADDQAVSLAKSECFGERDEEAV